VNSRTERHTSDHQSPQTWPRRIIRWLTAPARSAWRWFAHQPRGLQVGLVAVVLAALVTGGYYGQSYLKKRLATRDVGAAWAEYAHAVRRVDVDGIRDALDRVLAANPGDDTALRYRAMLDAGAADPEVVELAVVLMHDHIRHDRLAEAAREGEKVLTSNPKNWQARCAVAHHALQVKRDPALAERHLAQLPDPEDPAAGVNAGGLLYALRLSDIIGRDATNLRRLIVRRLLPFLRGGTAASAAVSAKVQLLECYLEPFADRSLLPELADYLGVADRLADSAVNEAVASRDVDVLVRLAKFGPRMRAALAAIRANDPARLPDDRLAPLVKSVDERTRRAWQAVREKSPDRPEAYLGLANLALLAGDHDAALAQVMEGIKTCGDRVEFLELRMRIVERHRPKAELFEVAESLRQAAVAAKQDPMKWCLAAIAWRRLHHNDRALGAADEALAIQRDHLLACRVKASILVESGTSRDFLEARDLLARLGELARRAIPEIAYLNARIMVGSGLWVLVEDEFKKVLETQARIQPKTTAPAIAFLLGVLSAPPSVERSEWVAARAQRVMQDEPQSGEARLLQFDALYQLADLSVTMDPRGGPPVWDTARVAAALRAFEDVGLEERTRPAVVAKRAALQLKGERNAALAMRTAAELLAQEALLNPFELEVLGSVLTANGKAAEAIRILEPVEKLRGASVGLHVALAVAYHRNNQPFDRDAALARAEKENVPSRSAREHAELIAAKQQFARE
jgi:tetratricopeptide (TPR) repeat protein